MGCICRAELLSILTRPQFVVSAALGFAAFGLAITAQNETARAADMAVPGSSYYPARPPPPAIYDWGGVYLGFNVGGGMLTDSVTQNAVAPPFDLLSSGNLRPAGVIGGGQIGANYEFAPWVVGLEGSWTASGITGNTLIGTTGSTAFPQEQWTSEAHWFAALTGRVGYAANDWLFYAKGGGAWMNVRYSEVLIAPSGEAGLSQVLTDNRTGFTVGVGIEYGLVENLTAKIEYDFYDFGSRNYNFNAITPVSASSNLNTIIVGLNYKFNWSGGPKP
jgi:outer membrane immunogenic protein